MVEKSAQSGFYKVLQNPPFDFTLHAIPLRLAGVSRHNGMRPTLWLMPNKDKGK
jgi:hypothetical protein